MYNNTSIRNQYLSGRRYGQSGTFASNKTTENRSVFGQVGGTSRYGSTVAPAQRAAAAPVPTATASVMDEDVQFKLEPVKLSGPEPPTNDDVVNDPEDIDLMFQGYIEAVPEYAKEIYTYLLQHEEQIDVDPEYMTLQKHITPEARSVVVDWLVNIHTELRLANESLFQATQLLDRVLSKREVSMRKFPLLAISCLFIASKFEQSYSPSIHVFVDAANRRSSSIRSLTAEGSVIKASHMVMFENLILKTSKWNLSHPNTITFLRRFARLADMNNTVRYGSFFLAEIAMREYKLCRYRPSTTAAACVVLASRLLDDSQTRTSSIWNERLVRYTGLSEEDIRACVADLVSVVRNMNANPRLNGSRNKYSSSRYYKVTQHIEAAI